MLTHGFLCTRVWHRQLADVALGEDVVADLVNDYSLKPLGVEPGGVAGPAALLQEGVADVIGELPALGFVGGEGLAAGLTLDDATEQVGAGGAAGMALPSNTSIRRCNWAMTICCWAMMSSRASRLAVLRSPSVSILLNLT